jgi:predicted ATPase
VHTPESALANKFGTWESYVDALESRGKGVSVLGVTDYFSIDGYRKICEYRNNGRLNEFLLVMPNIELRLTPELPDGKAINAHIIVSPHDPKHIEELDAAFSRLTFKYNGQEYSCVRNDLIRLGRAFDTTCGNDESAYRTGILQFKPSFEAIREWYGNQGWLQKNSLVFISNKKDGTGGLNKDAGFAAQREELSRFASGFFTSNPVDRAFFVGKGSLSRDEIAKKYGALKPCIHGSDAHEEAKLFEPDEKRYCWIKSDPTFEGFRQILLEPEDRVCIGPTAPQSIDDSQVIESVQLPSSAWFSGQKVELSSGLVSIIGEKGSGKTALAEMIAHAAGVAVDRNSPTSFLGRAKALLAGDVVLTWRNSDVLSRPVSKVGSGDAVRVRYLSQDFVERLCSRDVSGRELVTEIENVVFSHIPEAERLGTSSFEELRRIRTRSTVERKDANRVALRKMNAEIGRLQESIASRPSKVALDAKMATDIAAIDAQLPELQKSADAQVATELTETRALLNARNSALSDANLSIEKVAQAKDKYLRVQEESRASLDEIRPLLEAVGFSKDDLSLFNPVWNESALAALAKRREALEAQVKSFRDGDSYPGGGSLSIRAMEEMIATLESKLALDENQRRRLVALEQEKAKLSRERERIQKEIQDIDGVLAIALSTRKEERWRTYRQYFDLLKQEGEILAALYAPLNVSITSGASGAQAKFALDARQVARVEAWSEQGVAIIDSRRVGPLGRDAAKDFVGRVKKSLAPQWETGNGDLLQAELQTLLNDFENGSTALKEQLRAQYTLDQFYDWIYSSDHVNTEYTLRYDGMDLQALSPGTRGIVLLILYLQLDKDDRRPLVIDQPEGNLDSSSIYDSLVPYLREAKVGRQIILVTHNPNLVVGTDSEQVIVSTASKASGAEHPSIDYRSGALEGDTSLGTTKGLVCRLLEGGAAAFKARESRYSISTNLSLQ